MTINANTLLQRIEYAAGQIGITPATLCQKSVKNSKLPKRLQEGSSVTLATAGRLLEWIDAELARRSKS